MIKHSIQQPAAVGYQNARSLLKEKYRNPHQILSTYHKEIKSWSQLKPTDETACMKFYNFLLKCESVTLGQNWNVLDALEIMWLVLSKLPGNTREKWTRNVMNIRRRQPDFADIIHFVDDEVTLANDPLFSKEAFSGYLDKKEAPNQRKQLKTYLTAAEEKTEEIANFCQSCQKSHDLAALTTRRNLLKKDANFFFRRNCAMAVTHQYHLNTMNKSRSKGQFVTLQ